MNRIPNRSPAPPRSGGATSLPRGTDPADDTTRGGVATFFTGAGLPVFLLSAALVYETFLLAVVFAPASTGAWSGFAREFKQWCFRYDPRTGGMEWAAVWVMLVEPAFVVAVAVYLWRRGLRRWRTRGWTGHAKAAVAGMVAAGLAMSGLYLYGRPNAGDETALPFPGERIRTHLQLPATAFRDQKGRASALSEAHGKVVLVTGIYAMCSTSCPEILRETKALLDGLPASIRARVAVAALSLNPEEDTTALMDRVTAAYGFTYPEFRYLNGAPPAMHETLTQLGFSPVRNQRTGVVDHANLFLLVDARGEIAYRFTLDARHREWLRAALISLAQEAGAS